MGAGTYRRRITIKKQTPVSDGKGGWTRSWTDVAANVPAEIISLSGRETMVSSALPVSESTFRIRIRYLSGIEPDYRVTLEDDRELNIRSAEDADGRRRELTIIATTELPSG